MQWIDLFYLELKCSLLLIAAGLLCLLFRRGSAAQRHMAWSLAMVGAILIPLVVFAFPQWKLPVLPEPPIAKSWIQIPVASDTPPAVEQPYAIVETAPVVDSKPLPALQSEPKKRPAPSTGAILTGLWGLGGCMVLLSMGIGLFAVGRMVGKARPADPAWMQRLLRLRKRLGIARPVELLETKGPSMPIAVGLLKHRIMLPESGRDWPAKEQEAVLAHELAHIKRRDCLLHFISTIALALHWFNPLFWYAMRRMRLEREHACDDHVLGVGAEPTAYADQLLTIARTMPCRIPLLGVAITMARKNALEGRLLAILDSARNRKALGLRTIAVALLLLAGIAASLAAITSVGDKKIVTFDFDNPPMAYEKKIRMAKPDHSIRAGGLRFKLSNITRSPAGTLKASLGLKDGYEIVSFRLFDHETRDFFHDSEWQLNFDNHSSTRKFHAIRVGETDRIRIEETGGTLPASLDLWLRIVENGPGERFLIPAREGASAKHGKSEVVIT
ncbi:MAG: M56 family metallopeptidase, partial [Verrucomicrobia bacterium]|nr:M56 family metallopeptidase [Verrucomicrobiota bacterium]